LITLPDGIIHRVGSHSLLAHRIKYDSLLKAAYCCSAQLWLGSASTSIKVEVCNIRTTKVTKQNCKNNDQQWTVLS